MKHRELSDSYLSAFCTDITLLLQAGLTPLDSVQALFEDEPDAEGKAVLTGLLESLEKGMPLSAAMRFSGYFPNHAAGMTEVGEKTGRLTEALTMLSEHYERQERLSGAVRDAVAYPAVLLVMMIAVILILVIRVLPVFRDAYARLGAVMPPLADRLMQLGVSLSESIIVMVVIAIILLVTALSVWLILPARQFVKARMARLLGDRGVFRRISSARFISVLAMAFASGLDPEEAVAVASGGVTLMGLKRCKRCEELLRAGQTLPNAMYGAGFITARDKRALDAGSRSGMTDMAMAGIAARCEREAQDALGRAVGMIEPALVISASVVVGIILLLVMFPLMAIMTAIG